MKSWLVNVFNLPAGAPPSAVFALACERNGGVEGPLLSPKLIGGGVPLIHTDQSLNFSFALSAKSAKIRGRFERNPSAYLRLNRASSSIFFRAATARQEGTFGKLVLPALQSGDRSWAQIRGRVHVRANGGNQAAAKIVGAADLFLPAVFGRSPWAHRRRAHSTWRHGT